MNWKLLIEWLAVFESLLCAGVLIYALAWGLKGKRPWS